MNYNKLFRSLQDWKLKAVLWDWRLSLPLIPECWLKFGYLFHHRPESREAYIKHIEFGFDLVLGGIFGFVSWGDERAEMSSGGENQPVNIIFRQILEFFLSAEETYWSFDLSDADDIRFSEYAFVRGQACKSGLGKGLFCLHYYNW